MKNFQFTDGTEIPVGTMYCIGKNYAAHAKEMGGEVPANPVVFLKPPAAFVPNHGTIHIPPFSQNVHHELELVVVIGQDCANISEESVRNVIAGYAVGLDMTLRDVQSEAKKKGEPWTTAKGFVSSAPISNVVPASAIPAEQKFFDIQLFVNSELRQKGNTELMERSIETLISYLSAVFTLRRGDCIFTGTPEGVSAVKKGDTLQAEIVGLTVLTVTVD